MNDISESLSQKIDDLIEKTTQKVELPPHTLTVLEEAAQAVAAAVRATEKAYGKDVTASVMKKAQAKARLKKLKAASGSFDDKTLSRLVGMAIESSISDDGDLRYTFSKLVRGDLDVPSKVEKAARDYETAAEEALTRLAGEDAASEAMDSHAPYYMWMTQEGHGVGIHDGKLDDIDGLDLDALDKILDTNSTLKAAHEKLNGAIENASFEILSDAFEELVRNADDAYNTALEAAEEAEKERDPSDYFPDGIGDAFAYQHNDVERFVEKNLDDRYDGDLAEVAQKALDAGISGDEIEKAMYDVGEYEFIQGYARQKNTIASSGQIGDVDLMIDADLDVDNDFGDDLTLKDVGEMMSTRLASDVSTKTDFDAKEAAQGEIKVISNIDGYVAFIVNPKNLAAKLGVK